MPVSEIRSDSFSDSLGCGISDKCYRNESNVEMRMSSDSRSLQVISLCLKLEMEKRFRVVILRDLVEP